VLQRAHFEAWILAYERAWRTAGTDSLDALFTNGAWYSPAPFEEALIGRAAIADFWDAERKSPDEQFSFRADVLAVDGDTAVARVSVEYDDERTASYKNLWIIVLDEDSRCRHFEEWPFFPGQLRAAPLD
jgi:hypothetical protein